jgi:hypothetical protein
MARRHRWLLTAGAIVVALVVLGIVLFPVAIRRLAVRQLEAATGRDVTITSVRLGLFRGELEVTGLRVASRTDEPPLAELDRLEAEFGVWPLLRGRLELHSATLVAPRVRVIRRPSGDLNVTDLIERYTRGPAGEPADVRIGRVRVDNGLATFEDRAVGRTWTASGLSLELKDLATRSDAATGTLGLTFKLGDAPVSVQARSIAARPAQAHVTVQVEGLDLAQAAAYQPPDAAVRLERGRFSTRLEVRYEAAAGVRAGGDVAIADLVLSRRGQADPFVTTPLLTMTSRDIVYRDGQLSAARLEMKGDPWILDASTSPPSRYDLRGVRVVVEDASHPARAPARVSVVAGLPDGASADVLGTATIQPLAADLAVSLQGVDLGLARPYVPKTVPVAPDRGRLSAALKVGYAPDGTVRVGGTVTVAEPVLLRAGQKEPLVTAPLVTVRVADVRYRAGAVTAGEIDVRADPFVTDTTRSPALRLPLKDVRVTVKDARYPDAHPAQVALRADVPNNGQVRVTGTATAAPFAADLTVKTTDVDLTLARPYFPEGTPVSLGGGRLTAEVKARYQADASVRAGGTLSIAQAVVVRAGQAEPLMTAPVLAGQVVDVVYANGAVEVKRLEVTGEPVFVDGTRTPSARVGLSGLRVTVEGARYPSGRGDRPARIAVVAGLRTGGTLEARGTVTPTPLAAALDVAAADVDIAVARPWIPADLPLRLGGARIAADAKVRYQADGSVAADGTTTISDVKILRPGESEPFLIHPRLEIAVTDLVVKGGAVSAARIVAAGAPVLVDDRAEPPRRFATRSLRLEAERFTWPARGPTRVAIAAELPESGTLGVRGTFVTDTRTLEAEVQLEGAALEPYRQFLPIPAPVRGRVSGAFTVSGTLADTISIRARGEARVADLTLGPRQDPPLTIRRVTAEGIDVRWPGRIRVDRVLVDHPAVVVERARDGTFALRRMLTPGGGPGSPATAAASPTAAPPAGNARGSGTPSEPEPTPAAGAAPVVEVGELKVEAGQARFIDRAATPFYSEEITRLALDLDGLSTAPNGRAQLTVQGVVGEAGALELAGEVSPFGQPFYLDVAGELRNFAVPRVNPYMRRFLDWIARSGQLSTKLHYRVVGDELEATNEIVVQRLNVERVLATDDADRKVGVPLGLAVSILKDTRGDIRLTVPIGGRLSAPEFSFGDAIATAIRNVMAKLVTAPFRAIGRIFQSKEGEIADLKVNPVTFPAGTATLTPEIARQLQRVADFLREAPYIKLTVRPVVTATDVAALKTQEVTARIQKVQREEKLEDFETAARLTLRRELPNVLMPLKVEEVVAALRDRTVLPPEAPRQLAERRLEAGRRELVARAGIEPERVATEVGRVDPDAPGQGRLEFALDD